MAFETKASLPPFKGSTFRGVFGSALKRICCALRSNQCGACLLAETCVYARVFESEQAAPDGERTGSTHPFVIEPPSDTRTAFNAKDLFHCRLLLFGWANDFLPYFVYAFHQMGGMGIGRRIDEKRGAFRLLSVESGGFKVYDVSDEKLQAPPRDELCLDRFTRPVRDVETVTVTLETPLRVKHRNRLQAELPFHVLMRAALRRIATLNTLYGSGEPDLDYRGLVERAQQVATSRSSLRWFDWRRYSNRQEAGMLMGGMTGEVTYSGDLTDFMPFLRYAQKVHVGKATTFGLGKIRVVTK
jgi:hypothetical protein